MPSALRLRSKHPDEVLSPPCLPPFSHSPPAILQPPFPLPFSDSAPRPPWLLSCCVLCPLSSHSFFDLAFLLFPPAVGHLFVLPSLITLSLLIFSSGPYPRLHFSVYVSLPLPFWVLSSFSPSEAPLSVSSSILALMPRLMH